MREGVWAEVRALCWKNLLSKTRSGRHTLFEIGVPVLFLSVFCLLRVLLQSKDIAETRYQDPESLATHSWTSDGEIAFTPNTNIEVPPPMALAQWRAGGAPDGTCRGGSRCQLPGPIGEWRGPGARVQRVRGFATRRDVEAYYAAHSDLIQLALVPSPAEAGPDGRQVTWELEDDGSLTDQIEYSIRLNATGLANIVYDFAPSNLPPSHTATLYYQSGFAYLEASINRELTTMLTAGNSTIDWTAKGCDGRENKKSALRWLVRAYPTQGYSYDPFENTFLRAGSLYVCISFMPIVAAIVQSIVIEKEEKMKDTMLVMGLSSIGYGTSWFITYGILCFITTVIMAVIATATQLVLAVNCLVLWLLLLFFALSLVSISFLISVFFNTATVASSIASFLTIALFIPKFWCSFDSVPEVLFPCLSAPICFAYGMEVLISQQADDVLGMHALVGISKGPVSLIVVLVMLLVDAVLYLLLAWYLDQVWVFGREHGFNQGLLFCLRAQPEPTQTGFVELETLQTSEVVFEKIPDQLQHKVAIVTENLTKKFWGSCWGGWSQNTVLRNVTVHMLEDQVTALLGHNGAGKTTLISLLCGLSRPTSGKLTVYGSTSTQPDQRDITGQGICPQHPCLFEDLTAVEHLTLFAALTGVANPEDKVKRELAALMIEPMQSTFAAKLSGGEKRRLLLAMALVGDPRIVYLDEPTAGMDPVARRMVWDLLSERKKDRVLVLTTHLMDEADVLGDRIAVLSKGELRAVGSPAFLKSTFGRGYRLRMVFQELSEQTAHEATGFIQQHISSAEFTSMAGQELRMMVPAREHHKFAQLFTSLSENQKQLGVMEYGISTPTLEEVFLRIFNSTLPENEQPTVEPVPRLDPSACEVQPPTWRQQMAGMFIKRFLCVSRDLHGLTLQLLVPVVCVGVILGVVVAKQHVIKPSNQYQRMRMDPYKYQHMVFSYESTFDRVDWVRSWLSQADNAYNTSMEFHNEEPLLDYLLQNPQNYPSHNGVVVDSRTGCDVTLLYNQTANRIIPSAIAMLDSAYLQVLLDRPIEILVAHERYYDSDDSSSNSLLISAVALYSIFLVSSAFAHIPISFAVALVREKETKTKHQLTVSGTSLQVYWTTNLIVDYLLYLVPIAATSVLVLVLDVQLFRGLQLLSVVLLLLFFGIAIVPLMYLLSFLFEHHTTCQSVLQTASQVVSFLMLVMVVALETIEEMDSSQFATIWVRNLFMLSPNFCLTYGLVNIINQGILSEEDLHVATWDHQKGVIRVSYLIMLIEACVFFYLVLLIDTRCKCKQCWRYLCKKCKRNDTPTRGRHTEDEDVLRERDRVLHEGDSCSLRLNELRKVNAWAYLQL